MIRVKQRLVGLAIAVAFAPGWVALAEAQRRVITENDLMKFVWVADPQISPDGSQVAFVRVDVNAKADTYDTSIWIVNTTGTDGPRRLKAPIATPRRAGHLTDVTSPSRGRWRRTAGCCHRRSTSSMFHGGSPGNHRHSAGRRQSRLVTRRPDDRVLVDGQAGRCRH